MESSVPVTFKVWIYCAVVAFSNTETVVLSDTGIRLSSSFPLVQVTVVAGPPVETQVRMESIDMEILVMTISPSLEIRV